MQGISRNFNIWWDKSGALLRAGDFSKVEPLSQIPGREKGPKKISRLRKGFSFTRPTPVRTGAVSRILHTARHGFTKNKDMEYRQYLYTERQALTTILE